MITGHHTVLQHNNLIFISPKQIKQGQKEHKENIIKDASDIQGERVTPQT
jgi:hypothetical protein